jgi:murein DD-endopeptidase MepM/ murein hydrolase activator NlpD
VIAVLIGVLSVPLGEKAEAAFEADSNYDQLVRLLDSIVDEAVVPVADKRQVAARVFALSGGAAGKTAAMYIWPVSGAITSPFGWRTHPLSGKPRLHAGIDIAVRYGRCGGVK